MHTCAYVVEVIPSLGFGASLARVFNSVGGHCVLSRHDALVGDRMRHRHSPGWLPTPLVSSPV